MRGISRSIVHITGSWEALHRMIVIKKILREKIPLKGFSKDFLKKEKTRHRSEGLLTLMTG